MAAAAGVFPLNQLVGYRHFLLQVPLPLNFFYKSNAVEKKDLAAFLQFFLKILIVEWKGEMKRERKGQRETSTKSVETEQDIVTEGSDLNTRIEPPERSNDSQTTD